MAKTTYRWKERAMRLVEDTSDDELWYRDLLVHLIAAERSRPGTFGLRTLSVLVDLEEAMWRLFMDTLTDSGLIRPVLTDQDLNRYRELIDAGLVSFHGRRRELTRAGRELAIFAKKTEG